MESKLSDEDLSAQRTAIALRVGVDALIILKKSPAITNVVLDRPAQAKR